MARPGSPGNSGIAPRRRTHRSSGRARRSSRSRRFIVERRVTYYRKPDWFTKNVFNRAVELMTRAGVSVWGSRILRVRGRKSGEWHSHPVNLLTYEGRQYLVAPRGLTQWVRNVRAAGGGELVLGTKVQRFKAIEISDEEKIPILRAYLKRWKVEVGIFFQGVSDESPESELKRIAPDHPVFGGRVGSVLVRKIARLRRTPALDPRALDVGLARLCCERTHRFLDPGRELSRALFGLWRHRLADADSNWTWKRHLLTPGHHLKSAADVHRHDWRAGLVGQVPDPGFELLDAAVWRAAALGKQDEIPAGLQELARAVQLCLRPAGTRERKGVEKEADDVAQQRPLDPVVGGRGDHGAFAGTVGESVEDQRGVGVARVIGREDHRALE